MENEKSTKPNENYKNLVDCYYLLLKKFKKKSSYVIDEFLIKENKESNGTLTIYEDVNSDAFSFLILSMIDSSYDRINRINILNVQNGNDIIKAICFYMDNIKISELLKKNIKNVRKKSTNVDNKSKLNLKKKGVGREKEPEEEPPSEVVNKNMCNVKSFSLFNSNIDINGIVLLSKSLYDNGYAKLENLSIDCINLNCHCLKYLSLSLCNYNSLKTLSFQYCNMGNDCIKYIIDIVIYLNSSLTTLNLSGNKFDAQGMHALFESFLLNNSLSTIDVSYNMFNLDDSFVETFCKIVVSKTNISSISLIGNFVENDNLAKINDAMTFNKSISILKLPHEVDREILKQINLKLVKRKRRKKKVGKKKA
ncbi:unnamed protein product [Plasmodium vivax]|uniref:Leucine-rich repeat protein n=2 Tax=Plasmodium vivax TaxID=5855 RepID=A0A0J9TH28_PLAVI|nr:hypothetical protein PVMG_02303 [Plasmodium vivax Mauritania I]CAG9481876.1 unnamed protein product [Plasmodium vivax]CAI7719332.1 conserved Plasmodium protein, unknown function [Plasmodium vivax]SCO66314.1 conserved Plasmodium protein, unknown function [Plasmodium vivax]VUZ94558.1 conserved Plasmodium protein, unknown function [Plasmodium vivax]